MGKRLEIIAVYKCHGCDDQVIIGTVPTACDILENAARADYYMLDNGWTHGDMKRPSVAWGCPEHPVRNERN